MSAGVGMEKTSRLKNEKCKKSVRKNCRLRQLCQFRVLQNQ
jgi:hypothetical protein